ncbi:MAG: hypothetical protein N3A69_00495 [Leptospiraceae bacterium]|nr:hypothetical protein [Leptospiraceae bacterium]
MQEYEVYLTKTYVIKIQAESREKARTYCELFTGDIQDISTNSDRESYKFQIENIECQINEAFEVNELL